MNDMVWVRKDILQDMLNLITDGEGRYLNCLLECNSENRILEVVNDLKECLDDSKS